jgi:apolipoprotein N-acyltransferase
MKNHFISLFAVDHRRETIILFVIAALFIIISSLVGISDNLPMIAMLLTGIILLFFTVLHPWERAGNYGILAGVCIGILLLEWFGIHILDRMQKTEYISEGIAMGVAFLFCLPGILVGIIGAIICAVRKK